MTINRVSHFLLGLKIINLIVDAFHRDLLFGGACILNMAVVSRVSACSCFTYYIAAVRAWQIIRPSTCLQNCFSTFCQNAEVVESIVLRKLFCLE